MDHKIPSDAMNSWVRFCVDEFVREKDHQEILLKKWFGKASFEQLAEEYHYSVKWIQDIIYDEGDPILVKALELTKSKNYEKPAGY